MKIRWIFEYFFKAFLMSLIIISYLLLVNPYVEIKEYICIDGIKTKDKYFLQAHNANLLEGYRLDMEIKVLQGKVDRWTADSLLREYGKVIYENNKQIK